MKVLSAFPPGNLINTVEVCPPKGSNFSKTLDTGQFLYLRRLKKPLGPDKFGTDFELIKLIHREKYLFYRKTNTGDKKTSPDMFPHLPLDEDNSLLNPVQSLYRVIIG